MSEGKENEKKKAQPQVGTKRKRSALDSAGKRNLKDEIAKFRAGGVYIPPHKMRRIEAELAKDQDSEDFQRLKWEALRKSMNGLVNKVNAANLKHVIAELYEENIVRGKGLLCRSLMKAQLASPQFTGVYTALIGLVNIKIPEIGELMCKRVLAQFRKAYRRNDKILMISTTQFIAHLINQEILSDLPGFELVSLLLKNATDDSIEVAKDFMIHCGAKLSELNKAIVNKYYRLFLNILQNADNVDIRVQYKLETLMTEFRNHFKDHPAIIEVLDIIPEDDIITHDITLNEKHDQEKTLNLFHFDPGWDENENEYKKIRDEILGVEEDSSSSDSDSKSGSGSNSESESEEAPPVELYETPKTVNILDMTNQNTLNMRRKIYLITRSSISFEEMAHKMLKMLPEQETACSQMVVECCSHEKAYNKTFGLLGERLCKLRPEYQDAFDELFATQYNIVHRHENENPILNIAKFFAHLLHTDALDWTVLEFIKLNERETDASKRIFIKILFQELSMWMGAELKKRLEMVAYGNAFDGLFPVEPHDRRFAINFFTQIGLGGMTVKMRHELKKETKRLMDKRRELVSSDSSDSSDSDSSDDSSNDSSDDSDSSDSSDSSSEEEKKKKRKAKPKKKKQKKASSSDSSDSSDNEKKKKPKQKKKTASRSGEKSKPRKKTASRSGEKSKPRLVDPNEKNRKQREKRAEQMRGKREDEEKKLADKEREEFRKKRIEKMKEAGKRNSSGDERGSRRDRRDFRRRSRERSHERDRRGRGRGRHERSRER